MSDDDELVQQALDDNVRDGYIEIVGHNDDGPIYRLTEAGKRRVENMLAGGK